MTRKKLFKLLNELCREMDDNYDINSGGCCYVAAVIAEQLELHNISFTVYLYEFPTHYVVKVSDRYLNRGSFNNEKLELIDCSSEALYRTYKNNDWNSMYSRKWNSVVKNRIKAVFRKYENSRT